MKRTGKDEKLRQEQKTHFDNNICARRADATRRPLNRNNQNNRLFPDIDTLYYHHL